MELLVSPSIHRKKMPPSENVRWRSWNIRDVTYCYTCPFDSPMGYKSKTVSKGICGM